MSLTTRQEHKLVKLAMKLEREFYLADGCCFHASPNIQARADEKMQIAIKLKKILGVK